MPICERPSEEKSAGAGLHRGSRFRHQIPAVALFHRSSRVFSPASDQDSNLVRGLAHTPSFRRPNEPGGLGGAGLRPARNDHHSFRYAAPATLRIPPPRIGRRIVGEFRRIVIQFADHGRSLVLCLFASFHRLGLSHPSFRGGCGGVKGPCPLICSSWTPVPESDREDKFYSKDRLTQQRIRWSGVCCVPDPVQPCC